MSYLADLLGDLQCRGVVIGIEGDNLRVDAPSGELTAQEIAALTEFKPAILAMLKTPAPEPCPRCGCCIYHASPLGIVRCGACHPRLPDSIARRLLVVDMAGGFEWSDYTQELREIEQRKGRAKQ